jgi:hypothetical protein
MEVNEKYIQIRGKIATDKEYALGDDISVTVTVTSKEIQDQDDGTINLIQKAKLFGEND